MLQNEDDRVDDVANALSYYAALKRAGVPVEMHLYAQGGHAFGVAAYEKSRNRVACIGGAWLQTIGMVSGT